ncbi:MAG: hypothetical protein JO033_17545 [Acidobacteriaceae bacterium]|nr:hypothetical protein [Acidobacteriaceae bacterium]
MINHSALCRAAAFVLLAVAPRLSFGVDTRVWEQSEQAEFGRGTAKHLSIRSDGRITLAPQVNELDSTTVPYLWAIAQDSKGTLYYGGGAPTGATAKIFSLAPNGKPKTFAELTGLEIHALAIDSENRVYAGVLPDAKIYRIDRNGKPQLFFDPKCKYIWAMAFDHAGNLFVATGDTGVIYKVDPGGNGSKFFETNETHARSMIVDGSGNLIVGTEPGGLIIRVTPKGQGFVLYQTSKREITALAERDGIVYAAAIGSKPVSLSVTGTPPVLPQKQAPVTPAGTQRVGTPPPATPPPVPSFNVSVAGGSDLYRIETNGFAERIWNSPTDLVYAIAFDRSGAPLLGTGNKGVIYRVDSDQLSTELLSTPPTQVTAFLQGRNNNVYAVTGNVGNLYSIGPGLEDAGTLESEVLDADDFAYWGRAHIRSTLNGGLISLETRSGNLNNPENNWSPWSKVSLSDLGGEIQSPAARFLQYRLTLACGSGGQSPSLSIIDIAYLPKNIAPKVQQIDLAPFNYREAPSMSPLERSVAASGSPMTLALPAVGQKRAAAPISTLESAGSATLQYSKGFETIRWAASDANGDPLEYKVEIKNTDGSIWHLLKDKLLDRFYAFDTAAFPDGRYVVRVTASDAPGNIPANALSASMESDPFTIDNTPPEIRTVRVNGHHVTFTATDALSWIDKAEYAVEGGDWILLEPVRKVTDSRQLDYEIQVPAGTTVAIRVFDEDDNVSVKQVPLQ